MRRSLALAILAHLLVLSLLGVYFHDAPQASTGMPVLDVALRHVGNAVQGFTQGPDAGTGTPRNPPQEQRVMTAQASAAGNQATVNADTEATPVRSADPLPAGDASTLALPATSPLDGLKREYMLSLGRHMLARPPDYPPGALKRGVEGTVIVTLRLDAAGNIVDARVTGSSGDAELDDAALRHVHARAPMPRPPREIAGALRDIEWDWPVPFRIE